MAKGRARLATGAPAASSRSTGWAGADWMRRTPSAVAVSPDELVPLEDARSTSTATPPPSAWVDDSDDSDDADGAGGAAAVDPAAIEADSAGAGAGPAAAAAASPAAPPPSPPRTL